MNLSSPVIDVLIDREESLRREVSRVWSFVLEVSHLMLDLKDVLTEELQLNDDELCERFSFIYHRLELWLFP